MDKHSIAAYLEQLGATLPAVGHGWRKMKCPFHGDKHASAAINYDDNRFKCFGCEAQGDVYDLIMQREGGNYIEAIKFAESISLAGNRPVRKASSSSRRVPFNSTSLGRRGQKF
jgi:DNA primase